MLRRDFLRGCLAGAAAALAVVAKVSPVPKLIKSFYLFEPKWIGRCYELEETTMYVRREKLDGGWIAIHEMGQVNEGE